MSPRRCLLVVGFIGSGVGFAACGLSPQPYPPETYDSGIDAGNFGPTKDATAAGFGDTGADSGAINDANPTPPGTDAEASDGENDAATDASGADATSEDAEIDAAGD